MNINKQGILVVLLFICILFSAIWMIVVFEAKQMRREEGRPDIKIEQERNKELELKEKEEQKTEDKD